MRRLLQTRGPDAAIAELAVRQHGVVARDQLAEWGMSLSAIDRRLRLKRLHRLYPGVYAVGHPALSQEGRYMAAVLACGSKAVLSHRSAAALWGIRTYLAASIDVTAPTKSRSSGSLARHRSLLPADEVTVERGIPVTTVPRTIFDLAAVSSLDVVENALREAEYLRLYDRLSLCDLLARYSGRRGTRTVRRCLARVAELPAGRTRSRLEERFLPFLERHRLPRPRLNAWIQLPDRSVQVDCLWPGTMNVIELDGWGSHGTRIAFREDRARDRRLRAAGYEVTRITWAQLDDEPGAIAADLRTMLVERGRQSRSVAARKESAG